MDEFTSETDRPIEATVESPHKSEGKGAAIIVAVIFLFLLGFGAWLIFGRGKDETKVELVPSPSPVVRVNTPSPTVTEEVFDKTKVKIQVLNGTEIVGAAGGLKKILVEMGYENVTVGNSDRTISSVELTFGPEVAKQARDEILSKLTEIYQKVEIKEGETGSFDIKIITGYPKGYVSPTLGVTATPTLTPVPTPTP